MKNFHSKTLSGIKWSVVSQVGQQLLTFIVGVILVRMLSPEEFGLIAMIMVITGFATTFSGMGLSSALIHKQNTTQEHYSSIFWVNICVGLLFTFIFMILAPYVAKFYHQPLLIPLTMFISVTFLTGSLNIVQNTLLKKSLDFRIISIVKISSVGISGAVAITMAYLGFGVWSLAVQPVVHSMITAILLWKLSKWRPEFIFKWNAVKDLLGFSFHLMGTETYNYWTRNLDNLLIGRFLGSGHLGIYNRAYAIMLFPLANISRVIAEVMFPSLSIIQKDKEKVKKIFLRMTRTVALITFPMMVGLAVIVEPFVIGVFGEQWIEMIPILRIFCFLGMIQSIGTLNGSLYLSQGRADLQFKLSLILKPIVIIGIIVGLRWGIEGVAIGYAIASLICYYPSILIAGRLVGISYYEHCKNLFGVLGCSIVMGAFLFGFCSTLLLQYSDWIQLAIVIPSGIIFYLSIIHLTKLGAYLEARDLIVEQLKSTFSRN